MEPSCSGCLTLSNRIALQVHACEGVKTCAFLVQTISRKQGFANASSLFASTSMCPSGTSNARPRTPHIQRCKPHASTHTRLGALNLFPVNLFPLQQLLESMDTNENGKVDFAEYCHFVLQLVGLRDVLRTCTCCCEG